MRKYGISLFGTLLVAGTVAVCGVIAQAAETVTIYKPGMPITRLNASDAKLVKGGEAVEIFAHGRGYSWPGPVWHGKWNLGGCSEVHFDIENLEDETLTLCVRFDDPAARQNNANWFSKNIVVPAKTRMTHRIEIPSVFPEQLQGKVVGMRGLPGGTHTTSASLDWREVISCFIYLGNNDKQVKFRVYGIQAVEGENKQKITADWQKMMPEEFFPMIDCYGQFKHEDWPGKLHNDAEFAERIVAEKADWKKNPRPECWDKYGGWLNGPKREATGHFRVEKIDGKWWFITPEGHLFWSHGTDCVGMGNGNGPISHREHYYEGLPEKSPFYGKATSTIGFYKDKGEYRTYNWTQSNLLRKYGADFAKIHSEVAHNRLESWAMNTIGNWSSADIFCLNKTPYVVTLYARGRIIEGSSGYWGKFPDPFADEFRITMRHSVKINKEALNSPYCLGAFTNNELSWGGEYSLSLASLASPANQPAKIEFVKFLQKKYETVDALNAVWKKDYADWDAILTRTDVPTEIEVKENAKLAEDLGAFYEVIAEQYFRVIREELKAAAPNTLDLGCRFAWVNDRAAYAMAKTVDVMSYNRYEETLATFELPEGVDMPAIIGEFHFGALDRGVFHTGLRGAKNQEERGQKYYNYVRSAVEHPAIVGTHWFQYGAQPTTGRFDGENYQIGLVDIADTPYPETIERVREIGRTMYEIRSGKSNQ